MRKSFLFALLLATALTACNDEDDKDDGGSGQAAQMQDAPAPDSLPDQFKQVSGNASAGQDAFRFETFGNERFWTDALRLPQGIAASGLTPLQALQIGLSVNVDALNAATRTAITNAIAQINDGTPPAQTAFGDPAVTLSLINQNAVIGVVAFNPDGTRKALANTGTLNIAGGDKVGLSCAGCHAITDNSVLPPTVALNTTGSIGRAVDGPTPHRLDVGRIFAAGQNSLAYYPFLQARFETLPGGTIGRGGFPGLATTVSSLPTEAEADTYLTGSNPTTGERFYPVGHFDDTGDGIGNPLHIAPLFRQDLAAPYGIEAGFDKLDDFSNNVFVNALDPTALLTPAGRDFLRTRANATGDELAEDYERVLRATGVAIETTPYVRSRTGLTPGVPASPTGRRVDETRLRDLNAYLISLPSPRRPADVDTAAAARGRIVFRTLAVSDGGNCTTCHQVDPNRFVPPNVIPMPTIYPAYTPAVLAQRMPPQTPIQNSDGPNPFFDDKHIVSDGSANGKVRGTSLVLLLDLTRKTKLLHDDSVVGTDFRSAANSLFDPARGANAAHPFYISDSTKRSDVIEFLRSLETER
ncbi:hypothetical protein ACFOMD_03720 [Sphingoaurantiacus capsulatus]|uniref:Cytochrome c domain-containing protein n=1 Tax=Sphingoaurantiacus capsulatus TaxID=1771310 RepID=A0ABV7X7E1_9SPHN